MRTDRLLKIIYTCLQHERVTIQHLAHKLEVSRRTVFRDLEMLSAAGIPVVTYPGAGGGVGIMEGFKLDKSLLTDEDFSRLTAALNSIRSVDGNKDVELLMDKLIPLDKRKADGSDIIIDLSSWFEGDEIDDMFADVRAAITGHRLIGLTYSTKGILSERLVEPYKLVFKYQSWYLYAFCRMREDFRMFKHTRVFDYTVYEEQFPARPLGKLVFQLQGRAGQEVQTDSGAPVEVVLEYRVQDKDFLLDQFGPQNFVDRGDKGIIRFSTTNLPWITDLIMSLQDKVKVLEPRELREEVCGRIKRMDAVYGN